MLCLYPYVMVLHVIVGVGDVRVGGVWQQQVQEVVVRMCCDWSVGGGMV